MKHKHLTLENILLDSEEIIQEKIHECDECKKNLMNITKKITSIDETIYQKVDSVVFENLMLKFKEKKLLGIFSPSEAERFKDENTKNKTHNRLAKYLALGISTLSLTLIAILMILLNITTEQKVVKKTEMLVIDDKKILVKVDLSIPKKEIFSRSNEILVVDLSKVESEMYFYLENKSEVVFKHNGNFFKFLGKEFRVKKRNNNEILINEEKINLETRKEKNLEKETKRFINTITLDNGEEINCNVISIKQEYIIIETYQGRVKIDRNKVKKIDYKN